MGLNEKQKQFCEEFIIDFNGTQAAVRAGYSPNTANEQAARLLANVNIQAYLKELIENRNKRMRITQDEVVANIVEVMQRCMQAKPVTFMGRQVKDEEGNNLWRFDSQGANKALDMLMKHTGGYNADNQQKQALMTSVQKIFVTPDEVEEVDKHIKETINNDKQ
jgi:phage terminase small subunit